VPDAAIDPRIARRRFERAAGSYAKASRIEGEIASRMLERLDYIKMMPRRVLDAGSGPPQRALGKRYPAAEVMACDFSLAMLRAGKKRFFERRPPKAVCGDFARLPFAAGAFDLVWSNMALHWAADPQAALREFHRVLAVDGLLMFSTLGPDTLGELRAAAGGARVHAFADMHDLGDMLVASRRAPASRNAASRAAASGRRWRRTWPRSGGRRTASWRSATRWSTATPGRRRPSAAPTDAA
jgi:malonyl-CoA O-methyltransferase